MKCEYKRDIRSASTRSKLNTWKRHIKGELVKNVLSTEAWESQLKNIVKPIKICLTKCFKILLYFKETKTKSL